MSHLFEDTLQLFTLIQLGESERERERRKHLSEIEQLTRQVQSLTLKQTNPKSFMAQEFQSKKTVQEPVVQEKADEYECFFDNEKENNKTSQASMQEKKPETRQAFVN